MIPFQEIGYGVFIFASLLLSWLFLDSLTVRFQIDTLFKSIGAFLLAIATGIYLFQILTQIETSTLFYLALTTSFYLLYIGFIVDGHARFPAGIVVMILGLFFMHNQVGLAIQAGMVALVIIQLTYVTSHRDFIPLGITFVLLSVAEFLKSQSEIYGAAPGIVYLFASGFLFSWIWQYLAPRLRIRPQKKFEEGLR